ncbi:MAG: DUF1016 family protein [Bacilli bacterium]|nr:DUF1016 family protein [Bacilli bacterium]
MNKTIDLKDNYYNEIKEKLLDNEINNRVKNYSKNKNDLDTYYNVGKLIVEAQGGETRAKYGDGLIKEYSKKLMKEIDKKYSYRNLMHMRKFYLIFKGEKMNALRSHLSWTHYRILLSLKDFEAIKYYIRKSIKQNLSYRQLEELIKFKEYERLDDDTKLKLINKEDTAITDLIPNPIVIKNANNISKDNLKERFLQQMIMEDIPAFLKSLGTGFTFIDNKYKIKIGDHFNYIDLLLYNYQCNSFVAVELKVSELKKEHIGQIHVYMNYIDNNVKNINQNATIGIILVRKNNEFIMEYCSDERIISREYELI